MVETEERKDHSSSTATISALKSLTPFTINWQLDAKLED